MAKLYMLNDQKNYKHKGLQKYIQWAGGGAYSSHSYFLATPLILKVCDNFIINNFFFNKLNIN